ncbi:unnamed protein product, partial [Ectocarpus sp. 12 AP-2014]
GETADGRGGAGGAGRRSGPGARCARERPQGHPSRRRGREGLPRRARAVRAGNPQEAGAPVRPEGEEAEPGVQGAGHRGPPEGAEDAAGSPVSCVGVG